MLAHTSIEEFVMPLRSAISVCVYFPQQPFRTRAEHRSQCDSSRTLGVMYSSEEATKPKDNC